VEALVPTIAGDASSVCCGPWAALERLIDRRLAARRAAPSRPSGAATLARREKPSTAAGSPSTSEAFESAGGPLRYLLHLDRMVVELVIARGACAEPRAP